MNTIINYSIKNEIIKTSMTDTFVLNKKNKFISWMINKLLKYKIIENYFNKDVKYTRIEIENKKIFDFIAEIIDEMYYRENKRPTKVILGYKQMQELKCEVYHIQRFNAAFNYVQNGIKEVMGLEITLNPYIDGIVIL